MKETNSGGDRARLKGPRGALGRAVCPPAAGQTARERLRAVPAATPARLLECLGFLPGPRRHLRDPARVCTRGGGHSRGFRGRALGARARLSPPLSLTLAGCGVNAPRALLAPNPRVFLGALSGLAARIQRRPLCAPLLEVFEDRRWRAARGVIERGTMCAQET